MCTQNQFTVQTKVLPATVAARQHDTAGDWDRGVISKVELVQVDNGGPKEREQERLDHFLHTFWQVKHRDQKRVQRSSSEQLEVRYEEQIQL